MFLFMSPPGSDRSMPYILIDARQVHPYGYTYGYTFLGALTPVSVPLLERGGEGGERKTFCCCKGEGEAGEGESSESCFLVGLLDDSLSRLWFLGKVGFKTQQ